MNEITITKEKVDEMLSIWDQISDGVRKKINENSETKEN